jgi:hypothetical protein
MVPWSDVRVEDFIALPDGPGSCTWKIVEEREGWLLVADQTGRSVSFQRPPEGTFVDLVYREPSAFVQLVEQQLGGKVIEHGERVECFYDMTPASQARHLWVHHANASTGLSSQTMENLHEILHQQPLNERQHHHVNPGERIVIV